MLLPVVEARDTLRKWRENNERLSEDIVYLWTSILEFNLNKLGNESKCSYKYIKVDNQLIHC